MKDKKNKKVINTANEQKLDKDQLSQAFVDALLEYDRIKEENLKQQKEKERMEFRESVGIKDYSKDKSKLKHVKEFFNLFFSVIRMLMAKKEHIKGTSMTTDMFKLIMAFVYKVVSFICFVFSLATTYLFVANLIGKLWLTAVSYMLYLVFSLFMFAWFRYCSIEIENTDDYNFVFGLFSSITAVVSLIISLIALVKGVG